MLILLDLVTKDYLIWSLYTYGAEELSVEVGEESPFRLHAVLFDFILKYQISSKICCFSENLAVNYFKFTALHFVDKFSNEE